jgi:hypothetical protein
MKGNVSLNFNLFSADTRRRFTMNLQDNIDEVLRENTRRDIKVARFVVDNAISGIEDNVGKLEEQRDYKMKSSIY